MRRLSPTRLLAIALPLLALAASAPALGAAPPPWHGVPVALGPDGADAPVVGFDVAQRDGDGRLALVLGFLDKVPSQ